MEDIEAVKLARASCRTGHGRWLRVGGSLSLRDVGRDIDVSPSTVLRWENGERVPRGPAAIRYGRLLAELAADLRCDNSAASTTDAGDVPCQ